MNHRIRTQRDAEPIGRALQLLPDGITRRVAHARFFAGADPLFAGLHDWETSSPPYERSYRVTAHVCWPIHLSARPAAERVSTVVLPLIEDPAVVIHELGHVLHEAIGFDCHVPRPVSTYAATNHWEAFAEAFTAWVCPEDYADQAQILASDAQTVALFEELAGWN